MSRRSKRKMILDNAIKDDYQITVMKDTNLVFPELFLEVWVEGDASEQRAFAEMFVRGRCQKATSPDTADLVIFTGGADVDPVWYGETPHSSTHFDHKRDETDLKLYAQCYDEGIPMFGVCRGAQFLHVMNGGKLWQDIDNHVGDHTIWDLKNRRLLKKVSSVHHQSCIANPKGGMEIIADSYKSTTRWANNTVKNMDRMNDVEAFFYRDTCCFGVQGHPEYRGYFEYMNWCLWQIMALVVENPDIELKGRNRRMKQDLIVERAMVLQEKIKEMN